MTDKITQLREDVNVHGEVHAVVEEAGAGEEIEIRLGTAKFESKLDLIVITDGRTDHMVPMDSIVRWYKPMEFTNG